jgi:hypothetical protein
MGMRVKVVSARARIFLDTLMDSSAGCRFHQVNVEGQLNLKSIPRNFFCGPGLFQVPVAGVASRCFHGRPDQELPGQVAQFAGSFSLNITGAF